MTAVNDWKQHSASRRRAACESRRTGSGPPRRGRVLVRSGVPGPRRGDRRDLYLYLPPSYPAGDRRYPVLYMHDGQNLFFAEDAFDAPWGVHETLDRLAAAGGPEAIVVGLANLGGERRLAEYSPFPDEEHGGGDADRYLEFLLGSVKPAVDRDFRTLEGPRHTGTLGSSVGGLLSLYALFRRPDSFGFAGAMSPALWYADGRIFRWTRRRATRAGRVYLDAGTREGRETVRNVRKMARLLEGKGFARGRDLALRIDRVGRHDERAWGRRLPRALRFLLPSPGPVEAAEGA